MLRLMMWTIVGIVAAICVGVVIFIGYSVGGPFFTAMGAETHPVLGGISGNSAINMETGLLFAGMSVLAIPVGLGLAVFYGRRRSASTYGGRPPRRRRP